jgi:hypothetical protein
MRGVAGAGRGGPGLLRLVALSTAPLRRPVGAAFLVALLARLLLIALVDQNFSFDGYQRWAGRDHLLVQGWLPGTQALLVGVDGLGGGLLGARVLLSVVGAAAIACGALVAGALGGPVAAWFFIPVGLFGPLLAWSTVPYQEGTYLLCAFGGLALALVPGAPARWRLLAADLVFGTAALVRYEAWPLILVWVAWRRQPAALAAVWAMLLWVVVKLAIAPARFAASPVDFDDWEGLSARWSATDLLAALGKLGGQGWQTGGWLLVAAGVAALPLVWRRKGAVIIVVALLGQAAATLGWLVGLETATLRMQAIPAAWLGLLAAAGAAALWQSRPGARPALVAVGLVAGLGFAFEGVDEARSAVRANRWEQALAADIAACVECRVGVQPRQGLGTRSRHDGCEVVQGLRGWRHGREFWCLSWAPPPDDLTHTVRWEKGGYQWAAAAPGPVLPL